MIALISIVVAVLVSALLWPVKCPRCGSRDTHNVGSRFSSSKDVLCRKCGRLFDSIPFS